MKSFFLFVHVLKIHQYVKSNAISIISFMLFNELQRFLSEIETDNLTVSDSEIITLDFTF